MLLELSYSGPDVKTQLISVARPLGQDRTQRWPVGRDLSAHDGTRGNVNLDVISPPR